MSCPWSPPSAYILPSSTAAHMTSGVGKISFAMPVRASIQGQAPVVPCIRIAIPFVAAEVMQLAFHNYQAAARSRFRQRGPLGPRIRGTVILPDFVGDRPGMTALETAREPDRASVLSGNEMRHSRRHVFQPRPRVVGRVVDVDSIGCLQVVRETAEQIDPAFDDRGRRLDASKGRRNSLLPFQRRPDRPRNGGLVSPRRRSVR